MTRPCWLFPMVTLFVFLIGCGGENGTRPDTSPTIDDVSVQLNPFNNLSTQVLFTTIGVEEARVVYWSDGEEAKITPFFPVGDGGNRITCLGLEPSEVYRHIVEGRTREGVIVTTPMAFRSGELPETLRDLQFEYTGTPSSEYLLLTLPKSVTVLNETGKVRWYREMTEYEGRDAGLKQTGNYAAFLGTTVGSQPSYGYYVEFAPSGEEVAAYRAPAPLYMDNHELLLTSIGSGPPVAHFFSYDIRRVDLTPFGGNPDVPMAGHQIIRMKGNTVEYVWNAWDHFSIQDGEFENPNLLENCNYCDFDHPNSLEIDQDGHYIASFAQMGEVTKIHSSTGQILWRLGGANNQFTFVGDPLGGFSRQHFVRRLKNGNLMIYDNGARHSPPESRVVEYALDTSNMTATMVWQYRHSPPIYTAIVGSAQRLSNGNTFIGFTGNFNFIQPTGPATMVEVDPSGNVVWEAILPEYSVVYRALPMKSLYEYKEL